MRESIIGMLRGAAVLGVVFCLGFGAATQAAESGEDKPDFTRSGWYLSAMGRYQQENFNVERGEVNTGDTDGSAGASLAGGYRINEFLASEIQGEVALDWFEDALEMGAAYLIGANVRAYYPLPWLDKRIQPVAIVGLNYLNAPLPDDLGDAEAGSRRYSAFALRAGFGAEVYFAEHWAFTFDGTYVIPMSSRLKAFPFASIGGGFAYRF